MRYHVIAFVAWMVLSAGVTAMGEECGHATVPPLTDKTALDAAIHPIPPAVLSDYLAAIGDFPLFDVYEGQNDILAALAEKSSEMKGEPVAAGLALELAGEALFTTRREESGGYVFLGMTGSSGAVALRLLADISGLGEGDALWVIDPTLPRAFGPYTRENALDGGVWLPTISGDRAGLMVKSASGAVPAVKIIGMSHFYRGFGAPDPLKQANPQFCHVDITCETNGNVLAVASGAGLMVIPSDGYDQVVGTGHLINNPNTAQLEPYFITSSSNVWKPDEATQVEVIWDYRSQECGEGDPPELSTLPRSQVVELLTTNPLYDMTLLELNAVPSGTYGRTYVSYSTTKQRVGDIVFTVHFPQGSYMRISYGTIRKVGVEHLGIRGQNEVLWTSGITEAGSAGAGVFLNSGSYLYTGCVSNGPAHSCYDTSDNYDRCSSFAVFYKQAKPWVTESGGVSCPTILAYLGDLGILNKLRAFRDEGLMKIPGGDRVVAAYYGAAPYLAHMVKQSPEARGLFVAATSPFIRIGAILEKHG